MLCSREKDERNYKALQNWSSTGMEFYCYTMHYEFIYEVEMAIWIVSKHTHTILC